MLVSIVWFWVVAAFTLGIGVCLWQQGLMAVPAFLDQMTCRIHPANLEELLKDLNAVCGAVRVAEPSQNR